MILDDSDLDADAVEEDQAVETKQGASTVTLRPAASSGAGSVATRGASEVAVEKTMAELASTHRQREKSAGRRRVSSVEAGVKKCEAALKELGPHGRQRPRQRPHTPRLTHAAQPSCIPRTAAASDAGRAPHGRPLPSRRVVFRRLLPRSRRAPRTTRRIGTRML
ncbi:hypothetical protein MTO96_023429 [Rhipicephalus appendiculatus]